MFHAKIIALCVVAVAASAMAEEITEVEKMCLDSAATVAKDSGMKITRDVQHHVEQFEKNIAKHLAAPKGTKVPMGPATLQDCSMIVRQAQIVLGQFPCNKEETVKAVDVATKVVALEPVEAEAFAAEYPWASEMLSTVAICSMSMPDSAFSDE